MKMESFADILFITSDAVMFWVLQFLILLMFILAAARNTIAEKKAGKGGAKLTVTRGKESMALFYGSYVALNGLLVALCLSVEVVKDYRVFWVVVDTMVPAYICLFNPWSRNKLLEWADRLRKIEAR